MKTVTIQIGNTDDKLSQLKWSEFIRSVDVFLSIVKVHFRGFSSGNESWQNACWVFEVEYEDDYIAVKKNISRLAVQYKQDSIAWTEGETEFING